VSGFSDDCGQCKEFNEAVDVYSFGVLCWEMMTGLEPWGHVADPKEIVRCTPCMAHHILHLTPHTSRITPHASHLTHHTSHLTHHISHLTPHASHLTHHTSHLTPHTSHLTPHTSQLHLVVSLQQRPPLPDRAPPSYPPAYISLIERCWAQVLIPHVSRASIIDVIVTRHRRQPVGRPSCR
jgi:hypothetical protein